MKGDIRPDHIPLNKYQLLVLGTAVPAFTFTEISGIEEELQTTELPDRTVASGGNTGPVEFTAKCPLHHLEEQAALELWFNEGKDPVSPLYKKAASLVHMSGTGQVLRTYSVVGVFCSKRALPDLSMANEGEMAANEWTFKADELYPI
jgi:hypothetical protein